MTEFNIDISRYKQSKLREFFNPILRILYPHPTTRWSYWNCSKFANWVRGAEKPYALGWDEWDIWHAETRKKNPVRYWLAEKGLSILQNILYFPSDMYHNIEIYIRNRYIDKNHYLYTGLTPGQYADYDTRIEGALMQSLIDFVEEELAGFYVACHKEDIKKNGEKYRFIKGKCPAAGLKYLEKRIGDDEEKSEDERECDKHWDEVYSKMKKLYHQIKYVREERVSPYSMEDKTYEEIDEIDKEQIEEDEQILIDIIKLRRNMWT